MLSFSRIGVWPMFRFASTILIAPLIFGTFMLAQTRMPSVDVGTVTLKLGMARDIVLDQLMRAGYKFIDQPPQNGDAVVIVTNQDISDPVKRAVALLDSDCELYFRAGVLTRIHTAIQSQPNTDRELAASLYAVFRQYEREGSNHLCALKAVEDTTLPYVEAKQIEITCSLGAGVYRSTVVRWPTVEGAQHQVHVFVFQDLWR
jgi:hypothetical protein